MSSLQQYTLLFEYVDGGLLAQEHSVTIDRVTNSQPISTVAGGYSGESPGAAMIDVTVGNAVPAAGFEFDAGRKMAGLLPAKLYTLGPGGKQLKGECFIISDSLRHGTNQAADYSFKARGPFALWT
jgi:hypothetical protein